MQMSGAHRLAASRERVWAALNDPEVLRRAIPGCESLERLAPDRFKAQLSLRVGPMRAAIAGTVTLSQIVPPASYLLSGEGQAGPVGFAKGSARVRLESDGEATRLAYDADAVVGGKLAQLGGRLLDATAHKLAEEFFRRLAENLPGAAPTPVAPEAAVAPARWILALPAAVLALILALLLRAALGTH